MNDQWVVVANSGGTVDRPDEPAVYGPFTSLEVAELWMEKKYGPLDDDLMSRVAYAVHIDDPSTKF